MIIAICVLVVGLNRLPDYLIWARSPYMVMFVFKSSMELLLEAGVSSCYSVTLVFMAADLALHVPDGCLVLMYDELRVCKALCLYSVHRPLAWHPNDLITAIIVSH